MTAIGSREAITRAKIVAAMDAAGDISVQRLCHVMGLTDTTLYRHIHAMRDHGQVHIVRWEVSSSDKYRPPEAIYRLGAGIDAINPRPSVSRSSEQKRRACLETVGTLPAPIPLGLWGLAW